MKPLTKRTIPLTSVEIEEFFEPPHDHLKYRLTMLLSWKARFEQSQQFPYQDSICGFEACLVSCRMFLQFLGLRTGHDPQLHLIPCHSYFDSGGKSDEVKVTDLGGIFVNITKDLTPAESALLARVHHGASKATAHLTSGSKHGFDSAELPTAVDVIFRLLKTHLFDAVKRPIERHYDVWPS